jgi:hypothetical protein
VNASAAPGGGGASAAAAFGTVFRAASRMAGNAGEAGPNRPGTGTTAGRVDADGCEAGADAT